MRIKILKEIEVDLSNIPTTAWGVVIKRQYAGEMPTIDAATEAFRFADTSQMRDVFPVGVVADLPPELAEQYVAAGAAEQYVAGPTGERLPDGSLDSVGV